MEHKALTDTYRLHETLDKRDQKVYCQKVYLTPFLVLLAFLFPNIRQNDERPYTPGFRTALLLRS
jgi:hypothetical protein